MMNKTALESQIDDIIRCKVCEGKHCANCKRQRSEIGILVDAEKRFILERIKNMTTPDEHEPLDEYHKGKRAAYSIVQSIITSEQAKLDNKEKQ